MRPITALLFDYSGVFTTPPLAGLAAREEEMGYSPGTLLRLFWGDYGEVGGQHGWHRLERGEISFGEFVADLAERCRAELGQAFDPSIYMDALRDGFAVHFPLVQRVRALRGQYRTALVTNNVREFGDSWRVTIPVDDLFDAVVDSCEVGSRKPEPEFYRRALEVVGAEPEEAVLLDDMEVNVEGARRAGMEGIVVTSTEQALRDLEALLARRS